MTAQNLQDEFNSKNLGDIWEDNWNPHAHCELTLTIKEIRDLVNLLRHSEGLPYIKVKPSPYTEDF